MPDIPERQKLACSLRFSGSGPLMSYGSIASLMGVSRPRAHKLVKLGTARLRAHGYDIADLGGQAER